MEVCSSDKPESRDVSSFEDLQPSLKEKESSDNLDDGSLVNQLETALTKTLCIEKAEHSSSNEDEIVQCESPTMQQQKSSQKLLNKCSTFPGDASSDKDDGEPESASKGLFSEETLQTTCTRSVSLPVVLSTFLTPLKLVPAIKGSREKLGASPKKLTVSWAPDVYDPIPTSCSHTIQRRKQQKPKNSRKNWKKDSKKGQQKGNSSRGGSGKDKKQHRKGAGSSDRYHASERLNEANDEFDDLTVGSPDSQSYCGTSFLKNSLTKVHYSVAEAL